MSTSDYRVEPARAEHIDVLAEIERAAAALFPDDVIPSELRASVVPRDQLEAAQREGRLWVASTSTGAVVGFAIAVRQPNSAFLEEIDVHPAHQKKGLGRRLIQAVIDWARAQGLSSVALTTFESVPWNAPFYSRLGFRTLAVDELDRELTERLERERSEGLRQRVAMRLTLA